jgi:lysophospholipase L1-like esterase
MLMKRLNFFFLVFFLFQTAISLYGQEVTNRFAFDFGGGTVASGYIPVRPDMLYQSGTGYGFEPGRTVQAVERGGNPLTGDFVTAPASFRFSVALPGGNYRVRVTLGDASGTSVTTLRAENRRLMYEQVSTAQGQFRTVTFLVNVRHATLSPGNELKLDSREWNPRTREPLTPTWDDKLTLHFSGERPCVCAVEVAPADTAVTVFLIGDSTVTDQSGENSASWGQQLPRWFDMPVVVANHAESGQTLKAFRFQRRWDKVMEQIKPGDYVLMQFGHNDSKKSGHDGMWPAEDMAGEWALTHSDALTDYKWGLAINAVEILRRGAIPVILSPITRLNMSGGTPNPSHGDYPRAAREAAAMAGCAFIDLYAMSVQAMNGLGTQTAPRAYTDGTHTTSYGGYILSRCVVEGIRKGIPELARFLRQDASGFEVARPTPDFSAFRP